jgi:hypothetical protein
MTDEATTPAPAAEPAVAEPDQGQVAEPTAADEAGVEESAGAEPTEDEPGYQAPIDIDSLPEDQQEFARSLEKRFKAEYSRKTAALAEQGSLKGFDLYKALEDPQTQEHAFEQLAKALGYTLTGDEEVEARVPEEAPDAEPEAGAAEDSPIRDPRVDDLLEERRAEARERQRSAIKSHIDSNLETYAESLGLDELPGAIADEIRTRALAMTPGQDGLPRVGAAIEAFEAAKEAAIELYLESKRAETPDVDGEAAVEQLDTSTEAGRLRAAEAVAARHV